MMSSPTLMLLTTALISKHTQSFTIPSSVTRGSMDVYRSPLPAPTTVTYATDPYGEGENIEDDPLWLPSNQPESIKRKERLIREHDLNMRFAQGEDLATLRDDLSALRENLKWALATDDLTRIIQLRASIEKKEQRDPDIVYTKALQNIEKARKMSVTKKYDTIAKYEKVAMAARECIPRLNMEGLWVGSFGKDGSELVNVTYVGDTLIATKVTGDKHVPRREISFRADLGPKLQDPDEDESSKPLAPVQLSGSVASKWGTHKLERYAGEGQVAAENFKNEKFVEGQLIMFNGYFSFLWIPSRHHIFFSRPKPELILHMMRDTISKEDEVENMRDHLTRCYNKETSAGFIRPSKREVPEPFKRIKREIDLVTVMEQADLHKQPDTEKKSDVATYPEKISFWVMQKWRTYVDSVLNDDGNIGFPNFH